jgi:hypothetical protein
VGERRQRYRQRIPGRSLPAIIPVSLPIAHDPTWFADNELSQLTPMPLAWDKTATGPSNFVAVADCAKVCEDCPDSLCR